ncbi:MAG TPA: zinc-binding dehydrogenase [Solirubrobacteraceae bacterium]
MRAAIINEDGHLRVEEVADPVAGPDEVLIEVRAASVNRRDLLVRNPPAPNYVFPRPLIPGSDAAGVRRDTGEEVVVYPALNWLGDDVPAPGWQLLGGPQDGTYAELVRVPVENAFPKPRGWSWEEAATLPVAGLTAYRALFRVGCLHEGETVLVLGSGSGVSTFAIQLARQAGARVLVTSSSRDKIKRALDIGAERGVLYTDVDWAAKVKPVDLVFDSVGTSWRDSLQALRSGGRVVAVGATGGPEVTLDVRQLYLNWLSLRGTTLGSRRDFAGLLEMAETGNWRPLIDSARPLAKVDEAHERMLRGEQTGKLVLTLDADG